jgi:hypothetical protein
MDGGTIALELFSIRRLRVAARWKYSLGASNIDKGFACCQDNFLI